MGDGRGGYYHEGKILVWDRYSHCSGGRNSDLASLHMIIIALSPKNGKEQKQITCLHLVHLSAS